MAGGLRSVIVVAIVGVFFDIKYRYILLSFSGTKKKYCSISVEMTSMRFEFGLAVSKQAMSKQAMSKQAASYLYVKANLSYN